MGTHFPQCCLQNYNSCHSSWSLGQAKVHPHPARAYQPVSRPLCRGTSMLGTHTSCAEFSSNLQLLHCKFIPPTAQTAPPLSAVFFLNLHPVHWNAASEVKKSAPPWPVLAVFSSNLQPSHHTFTLYCAEIAPPWRPIILVERPKAERALLSRIAIKIANAALYD